MTDPSSTDPPATEAASQSAAALPAPLTKADALAYLDWEIQNCREQDKAVGTSSWSIVVALSAVVWLLLGEARYTWAQLPPVLYLGLGFLLIEDFLLGLYNAAGEKVPEPATVHRVVRLSLVMGSRGREMLFELIRGALGLAILMTAGSLVLPAARWVIGFWMVVRILTMAFGLLMSAFDIEVPDSKQKKSGKKLVKRSTPLALFVLVLVAVSVVLYWWPVLGRGVTFRPQDYRAALLGAVAFFLTGLLIQSKLRAEIIPPLMALRRDLALGLLPPDDVAREASFLVSGLTASDYVQREFLKHEAILRPVAQTVELINGQLRDVEARLTAAGGSAPSDLRELPEAYASIVTFLDRLDKNVSNFRKTLALLPEGTRRQELTQKASAFEDNALRSRDEMKSRLQRIRQLLDQGSTQSPP